LTRRRGLRARFDGSREALLARWNALPERGRKRVGAGLHALFLVFVGWTIFAELKDLQWSEILANLPASPYFYVLGLARFLVLPTAETAVYSVIWRRNLAPRYGAFLHKRVLNTAVAGHSGDLYFMWWASKRLGVGYRRAFSAVKDATILSAAAANFVATAALLPYLFLGDLSLFDELGEGMAAAVLASIVLGAALTGAAFFFRRRVLKLALPAAAAVTGIHLARVVASFSIAIWQWSVGLPGVALVVWLNFTVLEIFTARLPFLPAREIVFLALSLQIAGSVGAPEAAVAALFLAQAALAQVLNLAAFAAGLAWPAPPEAERLAEEARPD